MSRVSKQQQIDDLKQELEEAYEREKNLSSLIDNAEGELNYYRNRPDFILERELLDKVERLESSNNKLQSRVTDFESGDAFEAQKYYIAKLERQIVHMVMK